MTKIIIIITLLIVSLTSIASEHKNILIVLTSFDGSANNHPTGFWAEELAIPYQLFKKSGLGVTLASPKGGLPPVDPGSIDPKVVGDDLSKKMKKFLTKVEVELKNTKKLTAVDSKDFDAVFIVGGHGAIWDLVDDDVLKNILLNMDRSNKVISAVCHGPAAFVNVKYESGKHLLDGHLVTGFSYQEEKLINLKKYVESSPMNEQLENLLEEATGKRGQIVGRSGLHQYKINSGYVSAKPWSAFSISSGNIVTGQNPGSSLVTAKNVIDLLK